MDVFEQLLTSSSARGSVNPETLEYIGQKASNEYIEKRASLNSAIVKLASQHPELNNEHIHRIAEFANNITFQHLFQKNQDKNVHFDIAEPGVIIRDLRDGGSPAHDGKVLHNKADYFRPPVQEEKNSFADPHSGMQDLFQRNDTEGLLGHDGQPLEKVASAAGLDPSYEGSANPVNDIYAEHKKLERAKDELSASYERADLLLKQANAEFYSAVKSEVLSQYGAGLGLVTSAVEKIAGSKLASELLEPVVQQLVVDGVSGDLLTSQLQKTAGKVLNLEHPMAKIAAGVVKLAQERAVAEEALREVEGGLQKTAAFLRKAGRQ